MIHAIISGALIYDGDGSTPYITDLAIVDDRIALIANLEERDAYECIDARGLSLAPGFIDVHSHSDELWLADGRCESKIRQGVTTEIAGNCGTSVAPLRGAAVRRKAEEARRTGVELAWENFDEFFSIVERSGVALNVASLVGLGTTRRCIRGDEGGRLDDDERRAQSALVRDAVEHGALGVSSGLAYVPSRFADREELVACAVAAREAGGARYVSHLRSEGDDLENAVDEAVAVAREAEVAVQLSHHKAAGKKNWGKVHRSLERIARARAEGLVAGADVYPYVALWTELATLLPEDALLGGEGATLARLRDPETAAALALRLVLDRTDDDWHDIMISTVESERNASLVGLRLDDVARRWRLSPARAAMRLLLEERLAVQTIVFAMSEDDVASVLSAEFVSVGSDASARATSGPTAVGLPHPRAFGCFPRVFGRFVRGRAVLSVEEAIRRMTSLPADQFGIADRGRIRLGAFADLTLFDAERIVDTATYEAPYSYPRGVAAVWVNGRAVVRNGETTGARPGRALRGGR